MAEENKEHVTVRLSASVMKAARQYAKDEGLNVSFVLDRALLDMFGIRNWPGRPKKIKYAKKKETH